MQCYADYAALEHSNSQCYLAAEAQHTSRMEYLPNVTLERASGWHQGFGLGSKKRHVWKEVSTRKTNVTNAVSFTCAFADMPGVVMHKLTDDKIQV